MSDPPRNASIRRAVRRLRRLRSRRRHPREVADAIEQADLVSVHREPHEAGKRWQHVVDAYPQWAPPRAYVRLSTTHRLLGAYDDAQAVVDTGLARHTDDLQLAVERAEISMGRRDWAEATRRWRNVLETHADAAPARTYARLSTAYRFLGELEEADRVIERGLLRYPREVLLAIERAELSMKRRQWSDAAGRFREVIDANPDTTPVRVYTKLSTAYRYLDDLEEVERVIELGRSRHPGQVMLDIASAELTMARRDWHQAAEQWHRILDVHGDRVPSGVYVWLSAAHRNIGQVTAAEAAIDRGLAAHPNEVLLAIESAELAMARKDWQQAADRWGRILDERGDETPARVYTRLSVALRNLGDPEAADAVMDRALARQRAEYPRWVMHNDTLNDGDRAAIRERVAALGGPRFSVLLTVTDEAHLEETLDSVVHQLHTDWELCVVDASGEGRVAPILERYTDDRVRSAIEGSRDAALGIAGGDWIVPLDGGEVLAEHGLYLLAEAIDDEPSAVAVYSDSDRLDESGCRTDPDFKPDRDDDLMLAQNLLDRLVAYRTDVVRAAGGFRDAEHPAAADWDLALRVVESAPGDGVRHVPFVLCHRRASVPAHLRPEAGLRVVAEHLERIGRGTVAELENGRIRVRWPLPATPPTVSVVIPTRDRHELLRTCMDGLLHRTSYAPVEITIVDNDSSDPEALEYMQELEARGHAAIVRQAGPFNFSRLCNEGVAASRGEVVLLLNNDIEMIHDDWLTELVGHALRPEVGAVGATLYYPNDSIQHAGVVVGLGRVAGHGLRFFPRDTEVGRAKLTRNVSAATAACLAVRRTVYDEVGGLDEANLPVAYNDVDLCLRIREAGYRVIVSPWAELYHHESVSRGIDSTPEELVRSAGEIAYMGERWGTALHADPFYNPNLTVHAEDFGLAETSRAHKPWLTIGDTPAAAKH